MTSHENNDQSWEIMTGHGDSSWSHFSLTIIPVLHVYSHHMTSYLETAGAVFEDYNRYCQLTRVYTSVFISINLIFNSFILTF